MKRLLKIPGIWLLDSSGAVKIDHDDIALCHHYKNVTIIVYAGGRRTCVQVPLKKVEDKLCSKKFFRCHRNYLINLDRANNLLDDTLTLPCWGPVPVSRRRRNKLKMKLEGLADRPESSVRIS
jgi:DNA-binding LytR/AlgR family response regulator